MDEYQFIQRIEDGLTPTWLTINEKVVSRFIDLSNIVLMLFQKVDLKVEGNSIFFESDSRTIQDRIRILYGYELSSRYSFLIQSDLQFAERKLSNRTSIELSGELKKIRFFKKYDEPDFRSVIKDYIYGYGDSPRELYQYLVKNDNLLIDRIPGFISNSDTPLGIHFILSCVSDEEIVRYNIDSVGQKIFKKPKDQIIDAGKPITNEKYIHVIRHFLYDLSIPDKDLRPAIGDKIIVLLEGSTDAEFLRRSMKILYPNYCEYFYFMDFKGSKSSGGVGDLVSKVKAFIGAGIKSKITAIFDNDAAGHNAIRSFNKIKIPHNVKVMTYPILECFSTYPVIVEDDRVLEMDINEVACSIELYCGFDTLTDSEILFPVKLKGIVPGFDKRQGEVVEKRLIQKRFRKKLIDCENDSSLIENYDWKGIISILEGLMLAHVDEEE